MGVRDYWEYQTTRKIKNIHLKKIYYNCNINVFKTNTIMNKLKKFLEKGKDMLKIGVVAGSLLIAGEVTAQTQDNLSSNLNATYSTYHLSQEEIKVA